MTSAILKERIRSPHLISVIIISTAKFSSGTFVGARQRGAALIEMVLIFVHPNFSDALVVARDEVAYSRIRERDVLAAIDVADAGTRRVKHLPMTLPYLDIINYAII